MYIAICITYLLGCSYVANATDRNAARKLLSPHSTINPEQHRIGNVKTEQPSTHSTQVGSWNSPAHALQIEIDGSRPVTTANCEFSALLPKSALLNLASSSDTINLSISLQLLIINKNADSVVSAEEIKQKEDSILSGSGSGSLPPDTDSAQTGPILGFQQQEQSNKSAATLTHSKTIAKLSKLFRRITARKEKQKQERIQKKSIKRPARWQPETSAASQTNKRPSSPVLLSDRQPDRELPLITTCFPTETERSVIVSEPKNATETAASICHCAALLHFPAICEHGPDLDGATQSTHLIRYSQPNPHESDETNSLRGDSPERTRGTWRKNPGPESKRILMRQIARIASIAGESHAYELSSVESSHGGGGNL